jgi:predicted DNA-binding transcriptional regulator AlpA
MAKKRINFRPDHAEHPGLPALVTAVQVASWLQMTVKAIYSKAERGSIPGMVKVGSRVYFIRSELLKLTEQGRVPFLGKKE